MFSLGFLGLSCMSCVRGHNLMNEALFFVGLVVITIGSLLIPLSSQIMGIRWAFRHRGTSVMGWVWIVILILGVLILALAAYIPG